MTSSSASALYLEQHAAAARAARESARLWRQLDRRDLSGGWDRALAQLLRVVTAGQLLAAAAGQPYVAAAVTATGAAPQPAAVVVPSAFAGVASDGRSLRSLLLMPLIETKVRIAAGQSVELALNGGLSALVRIVETQVADAGRGAIGVAQVNDAQVLGHERVVNSGACGRCIVLAGRFYRWSAGFRRHPRCHCTMRPVTRGERRGGWTPRQTPEGLYYALSPAEKAKSFSAAAQQAITDGANLAQIVNMRGVSTTGAPRAAAGRLTPEQVYAQAAGDREQALRLLHVHGYLT
jgi:hypothetical protein